MFLIHNLQKADFKGVARKVVSPRWRRAKWPGSKFWRVQTIGCSIQAFFFLDRCFSSPELRERVRLSVGFPASWSEQLQVDKKNDLKFMRMRQYPLKVGREFSWNRDVTKKVYWERLQTTNTYKLRKEKRYFMTLTMASGNMLRTFDNSRIPSSTDADTAETKKQNWASSE